MFEKAKTKAWPEGDNLHFHDLRGTAATKFYVAGLSERVIAEVMGWEEARCGKSSAATFSESRPAGQHQAAGRGQKENIACKTKCKTSLYANDFFPLSH